MLNNTNSIHVGFDANVSRLGRASLEIKKVHAAIDMADANSRQRERILRLTASEYRPDVLQMALQAMVALVRHSFMR